MCFLYSSKESRKGSGLRDLKSKQRWSYQKKFKNGEVILNTGLMLGYTKVGKDDEGRAVYEINEAKAEIVRRIYREYLAGSTIPRIAKGLEADGIPTKLGKKVAQLGDNQHSAE